jgi:hypothetical protein
MKNDAANLKIGHRVFFVTIHTAELPYILLPWTYSLFQPKNFHQGKFFKFVEMSEFLATCFSLKLFHSFMALKLPKIFLLLIKERHNNNNNNIIIFQVKYMQSAVDLRNVFRNFSMEILYNLNSVKNILKESLTLNFI